jgi:hypothetical protein
LGTGSSVGDDARFMCVSVVVKYEVPALCSIKITQTIWALLNMFRRQIFGRLAGVRGHASHFTRACQKPVPESFGKRVALATSGGLSVVGTIGGGFLLLYRTLDGKGYNLSNSGFSASVYEKLFKEPEVAFACAVLNGFAGWQCIKEPSKTLCRFAWVRGMGVAYFAGCLAWLLFAHWEIESLKHDRKFYKGL